MYKSVWEGQDPRVPAEQQHDAPHDASPSELSPEAQQTDGAGHATLPSLPVLQPKPASPSAADDEQVKISFGRRVRPAALPLATSVRFAPTPPKAASVSSSGLSATATEQKSRMAMAAQPAGSGSSNAMASSEYNSLGMRAPSLRNRRQSEVPPSQDQDAALPVTLDSGRFLQPTAAEGEVDREVDISKELRRPSQQGDTSANLASLQLRGLVHTAAGKDCQLDCCTHRWFYLIDRHMCRCLYEACCAAAQARHANNYRQQCTCTIQALGKDVRQLSSWQARQCIQDSVFQQKHAYLHTRCTAWTSAICGDSFSFDGTSIASSGHPSKSFKNNNVYPGVQVAVLSWLTSPQQSHWVHHASAPAHQNCLDAPVGLSKTCPQPLSLVTAHKTHASGGHQTTSLCARCSASWL